MLFSQSLSLMAYKTCITAISTHFVLKLYKNLRCSFQATTDAAIKGKIHSICSMPEFLAWIVCNGLQTKFTLPLGGLQEAGATETATKSGTLLMKFSVLGRDAEINWTVSFVKYLTVTFSVGLSEKINTVILFPPTKHDFNKFASLNVFASKAVTSAVGNSSEDLCNIYWPYF